MNRAYLQFGALFVISLLLWWSALAETLSRALHDDQYTHILLILPVSALFIFLEHRKLKLSSSRNGGILSVFFLLVALALLFGAKEGTLPPDIQLAILMFALVCWWISSFILCFGFGSFRVFLFPLCFLFWMVPWPQNFLDVSIGLLQNYSAISVDWLFKIFGIPVLRDGVVLSIPGLTIEVAKECSSIRSSLILLVSSMVLAQLFLRSKWRKALVILIAVPLSVAKNAIRIFTLSMLGIHVNRGFLTGKLHHQGGAVFYAIALIAVFVIVYMLQRQESRSLSTVSN